MMSIGLSHIGDSGGEGGGGKGGGGEPARTPQSAQSVPYSQLEYSAPGPPSSQSLSEAHDGEPTQVLVQTEPAAIGEGGGGGVGEGGGRGGEGGGGEGGFGGEGGGCWMAHASARSSLT